ncbi:MAG: hypothetical protein IJ097_03935 [Bacilli bacterium]|nr:hypothetical protein [Bacilli bacterium]
MTDDNKKEEKLDFKYNNLLIENTFKDKINSSSISKEKMVKLIQFEEQKQLRKLEKIKEALKDKNPKKEEKEYFDIFGCFTEKAKIELEAKYIKSKVLTEQDKYSFHPNFVINMNVVRHILDIIDRIGPNDVEDIKQALILIELDFGLDIAFFSEVDNVYKLKKNDIKPGR